ncbi:MAG: protease inhibitor I42 family protein [Terracidiphilus sp.]|nr:protease inhibitor I42 family protein [Terracidiphilus sp.]
MSWLVLFVLLGIVCSSPKGLAATRVVTDADKGGSAPLKAGDVLELRLKSNPSTGYMWSVLPESTPLLKLVDTSQTAPTKPGVGRPIFQIFRFQAEHSGEGILLLHYVRSWEKPAADEQQFEIHVVVR